MFKLKFKGACHGDDPFYIFRAKALAKMEPKPTSQAVQIREKMVQMWTDFAKYGNPTPNDSKWEPVKKIHPKADGNEILLNTLDINAEDKMVDSPDIEKVNFWRRMYKKYTSDNLRSKL